MGRKTMPTLIDRIQRSWNAFMNKDPTFRYPPKYGESISYIRPDRPILTQGNERSIISAVHTRFAIDVSSCQIRHVQKDENDRYSSTINSDLNYCLSVRPNKDQTETSFVQDVMMSLLEEGNIAIFPVDTERNKYTGKIDKILTLRVAKIIEWRPDSVKLRAYNDRTGQRQELVMKKSEVAILENPFYAVMNEPNSLAKRIARKLALLDYVDEQNGSGKMDLIIQLPYVIKTPGRQAEAEKRRTDIEMQLSNSKYGIAYIDGTEHITQLNRSIENQLLPQIEKLKYMYYSQLGMTDEILNGTADENTMNNYWQRTITPFLVCITEAERNGFLTDEQIKSGQDIMFFNDPLKLVPTGKLAELGDKLIRNEILTPNEVRQGIGFKPSADPKADELRNPNISVSKDEQRIDKNGTNITESLRKE